MSSAAAGGFDGEGRACGGACGQEVTAVQGGFHRSVSLWFDGSWFRDADQGGAGRGVVVDAGEGVDGAVGADGDGVDVGGAAAVGEEDGAVVAAGAGAGVVR